MRLSVVIALVLLALAPVVIVALIGLQSVRRSAELEEDLARTTIGATLAVISENIDQTVQRYADQVVTERMQPENDADALRRRTSESPFVRQYFLFDTKGRPLFPDPNDPRTTRQEREALERTRPGWLSQGFRQPGESKFSRGPRARWVTWFSGPGLQFMIWWSDESENVIHAAEVNRARFLAEILGELPDRPVISLEEILSEGRISLLDSQNRPMGVWGSEETSRRFLIDRRLAAPVGAWKLEYTAPRRPALLVAGSSRQTAIIQVVLTGMISALLVGFVLQNVRRRMREASQRVTFVNRVSHELKTPLTNIRMYAELMKQKAETIDDDPDLRESLDVVVAESQRLSRMITNILTFGSSQREPLAIRRTEGQIDDALRATVASHAPSLERASIRIETDLQAGGMVRFDHDALEQIVGNLLSNVEKYASDGGLVRIESRRQGDHVEMRVSDRGPGLSASARRRVFEPFYRADEALTAKASGSGIGLTISRELARAHGGDLTVESDQNGAIFVLRLRVASAVQESER